MLKSYESGFKQSGFASYNRKQRTILMDEYLASIGLRRKLISRDPSCLFRAVSEQIFSSQGCHLQIRKSCVNYLEKHKSEFQGFVDVPFDEYLTRLSDTNEAASQLEISAISQMYQHDFIIYQYPDQEPENVTSNGFEKYVYLCFSGRSHYDCVYPINYFDSYAVCQSIVYEILLDKVFAKPSRERTSSVNTLRLLRMSDKLQHNETNEDESALECRAENIFIPPFDTLPPSIGIADKRASLFQQSCWTYRFPMALDVARALDPCEYRNTEYDMWMKVKRKQQHIDFSLSVGIPYNIGDKCLVYLSLHGKPYIGHVQEVSPNNGPITVFIEELGYASMHTLTLMNVTSFDPDKGSTNGHSSSKGKVLRKSSKTRSKSSSVSTSQYIKSSNQPEGKGEQGFDPKVHVQYVMRNKQIHNLLTSMQDNESNEPPAEGRCSKCNKIRRRPTNPTVSQFPQTDARSLSYSDISGSCYEDGEQKYIPEEPRTRQRTTSEAWHKSYEFEEQYTQRCQSMENLNIDKVKKPKKLQQQPKENQEEYEFNENLQDFDIPSNSSGGAQASSYDEPTEEYREASFSSPDLTSTAESTESSQVLTDTGNQSNQVSEVVIIPQEEAACYMHPTVPMHQNPNLQGHYMNVHPHYSNGNVYHNVQEGTYFSIPNVPMQVHPNGHLMQQPTPYVNIVDQDGKDLNFYIQLGMEYYRHTQMAANQAPIVNPNGEAACNSGSMQYVQAPNYALPRVQYPQPVPQQSNNQYPTFVSSNQTPMPGHFHHAYQPHPVFYVPVVPGDSRYVAPQQVVSNNQ